MNDEDKYLRDLFAGLAMMAMIPTGMQERWKKEELAYSAYDIAQAMMARKGEIDADHD